MQRRSAARAGFFSLGLLAILTGVGACTPSSDTSSQTTTSVGSMPSLDSPLVPIWTGDLVEPSRVAVIPDDVQVSADRRTLTVRTSYATFGFCVKLADGLDVRIDGASIVVSAWLASNTPSDGSCTLECSWVTQSITLADPIPADAQIIAVDEAVPGCLHGVPTFPTTTVA